MAIVHNFMTTAICDIKNMGADIMKKQKQKKNNKKLNVRGMLLMISVIPLILSIIIVSAISAYVTKKNMEDQVENTLYVAANILATHCSGNRITQANEMSYYEYLDTLKEKNIEMAIVFENATCASSVRNENDYRIKEIEFDKNFVTDKAELEAGFFDDSVTIYGNEYFGYYMPIITEGEIIAMAFAGQSHDAVTDVVISSVISSTVPAVIIVAVFAVLALFLSNGLVKAVAAVGRSIEAFAKGDLSVQTTEVSSVKELDNLLSATDTMQKSVTGVIEKVKSVSGELSQSIGDVTALSNSSAERARHITNAMEELSVTSASMAENVQNINVQMIQMDTEINEISDDVEHLYQNSENILKVNEEAKADMDIIIEDSHKSVNAIEDILVQIKETNSSIKEIDKAVSLILSIADQTGLLSLNASIEAARAGEAGRGFAVVAEEIGSLSAQSAEGAEMIKNLALTIMEKSSISVELATEVSEQILKEQDSITKTKGKYEELSREIDESAAKIKDIATKTDNLTGYKEKVVENVQSLSAISEENYASNEEVSANIGEIVEEVHIINENCDKINSMAKELDESAMYFHN